MDDRKLRQVLATANMAEERGDYERAEAGYLEAVELAGDDKLVIGQLHINLGRNADAAGYDDDAVSFYLEAIESLEGLRGDGLIQCAYAHWNLARTLLRIEDERAVHHAARAKEMFDRHPFASPVDVADADVLYVTALVENGGTVPQSVFRETWEAVVSVSPEELDPAWMDFVVNYLHLTTRLLAGESDDRVREFRRWAPPDVADEILRVVRGLQRRNR